MGFFKSLGRIISAPTKWVTGKLSDYFLKTNQIEASNQANRDTIQAQKELAEYSYNKDLEMWNRANEYNSPSAQMSRLKDAGLNPNLVYGNGSVVGNTSTQTPKYQMYDTTHKRLAPDYSNVMSVLGQFMQLKLTSEDVKSKAISNQFLENFLYGRNLNQLYSNKKNELDLGIQDRSIGGYDWNKSPYLSKQQSGVKSVQLDNAMKELELNFYKSLGTGSKATDFLGKMLMMLMRKS